jgi:exopolysaccharide biosynthesis polyprenyl glycosylphosphotransferase
MAESAATAADQQIRARAANRGVAWIMASVAGLVSVDVIISILTFVVAFKLRTHENIFLRRKHVLQGIAPEFRPYLTLLMFVPFIKIYSLRRFGLYKLRGEFSFHGDLANVFKAATLSFMILVLTAFLFRQGFTYHDGKLTTLDFSYSRMIFVVDWLLSLAAFSVARGATRIVQILYRYTGRNLIPTIVVGCGEMAQVCISEMSEKPKLGYRLLGVVKVQSDDDTSAFREYGVRVLGEFDGLPELVKRYGIEEVLISDTRINPAKLFEVLMECGRDHQIRYSVIPSLFDCMPGKTEIGTIGALPMIKLYEEPLRGPVRALKRGMDVAVSLLVLLLTWPVWLVLAILIKLESPGPVFYPQERVGMDGKMFLMIKFRSMLSGAGDQPHREVMNKMLNGEDANQGTDTSPVYGKVKDDPRLTRTGKWMRRYSVDELPQVINVLKGQMSWVGPRPPIPYEVRLYKQWHRARFHVKPGITGLWQVSGRNRLHFEEMVRLDIFYIENWSPWMDLKILLKTLPVVLRGDNTY